MKKAMMNTILVLSILIGLICVANAENNQLEFLQNLFHEYFPDYSYCAPESCSGPGFPAQYAAGDV